MYTTGSRMVSNGSLNHHLDPYRQGAVRCVDDLRARFYSHRRRGRVRGLDPCRHFEMGSGKRVLFERSRDGDRFHGKTVITARDLDRWVLR